MQVQKSVIREGLFQYLWYHRHRPGSMKIEHYILRQKSRCHSSSGWRGHASFDTRYRVKSWLVPPLLNHRCEFPSDQSSRLNRWWSHCQHYRVEVQVHIPSSPWCFSLPTLHGWAKRADLCWVPHQILRVCLQNRHLCHPMYKKDG